MAKKQEPNESKDRASMNWTFVVPFLLMFLAFFMMIISRADTERIVPVFLLILVSLILSPFWLRMRYRHELEKQKMKETKPEVESRSQKLEERVQNLEALISRLDESINRRLEHSPAWSAAPGLSQTSLSPTVFLSLPRALESRYQVLKELGRGGMGVVLQAHDKELKEQVALKILSPVWSADPSALERLKREVSAARRISHPNIIRIYDFSEMNGLHCISMELFGGASLKEYVQLRGPLSEDEALPIVAQICDGLEAAHRHGVIHRDLKSPNVLINATGDIKIIDFGLARANYLDGMTASGLILGTPEYMAPEQFSAKKIDERSDIYALGIICYELLTGRTPFKGETAIAIGFQQVRDIPPRPSTFNTNISPAFEVFIMKALEKNPQNRYQFVSEMRAALDEIMKVATPTSTEEKRKTEGTMTEDAS